MKAGLLINATRVAIVGQAVAPPLFDTMLVLGQERVVEPPAARGATPCLRVRPPGIAEREQVAERQTKQLCDD